MDDQEYNGLTLEGLAQRLEALERENAELRNEVAALRGSDTGPAEEEFVARFEGPSSMQPHELAALRGADTGPSWEPVSEFDRQASSRQSLLRKAGAAALGVLAARGLTPQTVRGAIFEDAVFCNVLSANIGILSKSTSAGFTTAFPGNSPDQTASQVFNRSNSLPAELVENVGSGPAVLATSAGLGPAVEATADTTAAETTGVRGAGATGVWGRSSQTGWSGVYGDHLGEGYGVVGDGAGPGNTGVFGRYRSADGYGVHGQGPRVGVLGTGNQGYGVRGKGKFGGVSGDGESGVEGHTTARGGYGVRGEGSAIGTGVFGRSLGNGFSGVRGVGLNLGYGGTFQGGKAQLRLIPGSAAGEPTGAHEKGEIYLDSDATLWICEASGNPATWRAV